MKYWLKVAATSIGAFLIIVGWLVVARLLIMFVMGGL